MPTHHNYAWPLVTWDVLWLNSSLQSIFHRLLKLIKSIKSPPCRDSAIKESRIRAQCHKIWVVLINVHIFHRISESSWNYNNRNKVSLKQLFTFIMSSIVAVSSQCLESSHLSQWQMNPVWWRSLTDTQWTSLGPELMYTWHVLGGCTRIALNLMSALGIPIRCVYVM